MEIEILKKSVERFWQTVDFGSALPDGVRIATCVAAGDGVSAVLGDGELSIVEKGRAVRMMIEKGQPDGDHALMLVLTLSDGQVVAQDVVVRASDALPAHASVPVAKSPAREYAGHFAQPTNAAHQDAYAVRAYGSGPDDKRVFRAKTAGLPVMACPECDVSVQGERREVTVKELALSRNALSRGKMSRMASALRDGVREGDDFAAIKVAELHDGDGEGPRYAVLPGQGNHRVAHLMLSRKAGIVPVMVVPRKGVAKYDPDQPRDEGGRFGEGGGGSLPGQDAGGFASYAGSGLGSEVKYKPIAPGTGVGRVFGGKPLPAASKTPSADEQRAAFRQKIGDAARTEFGTDKPSRGQVQERSQGQKAKYGKSASVWVWDPSSGGAMPGTVDRDAKSETYERSGQREDRQYVVQVPDLDKGGTRPVTAYHGDIAPRGVRKQLSTSTPGKGAEWTPIDMAGRRARRRERVARKRKKTLTR